MSLQKTDVEKIAHLARLGLDEAEIQLYTQELTHILTLIEQICRVDTQNIEPMAHPLDTHQRLRDDAVTETNQRSLFQSIAPEVEAGLYLVPTVIE